MLLGPSRSYQFLVEKLLLIRGTESSSDSRKRVLPRSLQSQKDPVISVYDQHPAQVFDFSHAGEAGGEGRPGLRARAGGFCCFFVFLVWGVSAYGFGFRVFARHPAMPPKEERVLNLKSIGGFSRSTRPSSSRSSMAFPWWLGHRPRLEGVRGIRASGVTVFCGFSGFLRCHTVCRFGFRS